MDVIDRRSSSDSEERPATHGEFECFGCKTVHRYRLPLSQEMALEIARQHRHCKHGRRKNVKYR